MIKCASQYFLEIKTTQIKLQSLERKELTVNLLLNKIAICKNNIKLIYVE